MAAPENQTRRRLLAGEMQIGAWLDAASMVTTEIAGSVGFDWCLIDAEHGPSDVPLIRDQLMVLASVGCPSAVRVPVCETWVLKQALDAGAQTLLVPMVDTAEQALVAARAVRYPPTGNRGLAGVVRAAGYGADPEYRHTANDQICLMVQAESRSAVENIDAIAATEGVDCVFVGPADLAADMGYLGNPSAKEVRDAVAHIMARTKAAGKAIGMFCTDHNDLADFAAMGATFISVAVDVFTLRAGLTAAAASARSKLT